ncbi:MAG: amino acid permease [Proteobacteria bacterium]|nr:amino acid permease [Pseudomonadota bacterium]
MKDDKIRLLPLTAIVTGNMMGSGIFMLPANLAQIGSISILGWLLTAIGSVLLALVFSGLGLLAPKPGGPYAYVKDGYGDYLGFQTVYAYWLAAWIGNIAIAIVSVGYLSYFFSFMNTSWIKCLAAIAIIWFFTIANSLGAKFVGKVQTFTTATMLIPILGFALFGWLRFNSEIFKGAFNVSGQSDWSALSSAASLTLWSFIGVESASVTAGEIENPQRNIPLATLLGVILAAGAYILSTIVIMGIVPNADLAHSESPFALAADYIFGPIGGKLVSICAIIACLGSLAGWTLLVGQSAKAAADDKLFPKIFSKTNQYKAPFAGLLLVACLMTVILLLTVAPSLSKQFEIIGLITVFLSLLPYLYSAGSAIIIGYRMGLKKSHYTYFAIISLLAVIYSIWTISSIGQGILYYGILTLLLSIPLYIVVLWHRQHANLQGRIWTPESPDKMDSVSPKNPY